MIKNELQFRTTRAKLRRLRASLEDLAADDRATYESLIQDLSRDLAEFSALRDGLINSFEVQSIDELGDALIKARIAKGWTQRDLARALGVSEQMVQRDESRGYASASLVRTADVAEVLGYELSGTLGPALERVKPAAIQIRFGEASPAFQESPKGAGSMPPHEILDFQLSTEGSPSQTLAFLHIATPDSPPREFDPNESPNPISPSVSLSLGPSR